MSFTGVSYRNMSKGFIRKNSVAPAYPKLHPHMVDSSGKQGVWPMLAARRLPIRLQGEFPRLVSGSEPLSGSSANSESVSGNSLLLRNFLKPLRFLPPKLKEVLESC